ANLARCLRHLCPEAVRAFLAGALEVEIAGNAHDRQSTAGDQRMQLFERIAHAQKLLLTEVEVARVIGAPLLTAHELLRADDPVGRIVEEAEAAEHMMRGELFSKPTRMVLRSSRTRQRVAQGVV